MTKIARRKYQNSPIIEVLCEINFEKVNDDEAVWESFHKQISDDYPHKDEGTKIIVARQQIEGENIAFPEIIKSPALRLYNEENTKIIQLSDDEITFNDVELPYKGFDSFRENLIKIIQNFIKIAKPKYFRRLELRYVNEIRFNLEKLSSAIDLNKYFNYIPEFDESMSNFHIQFELKPYHTGHAVFATIRTIPLKDENELAFLIDIQNIYLQRNVVNVNNIEQILNNAHENVGRVFEKLITDDARALFKEVENDSCNW